MKTKEITAYFCDHCNKLYRRKNAAIKHEIQCKKNPDNKRACMDCIYLTMESVDKWEEFYNGEEKSRKVDIFHCSKIKAFLYTAQNDHKNNYFDGADLGDGEKDNVPMRKTCEHFKNFDPTKSDPLPL